MACLVRITCGVGDDALSCSRMYCRRRAEVNNNGENREHGDTPDEAWRCWAGLWSVLQAVFALHVLW